MNQNPPNQPYEAKVKGFQLVNRVPLKLYLTDFIGRDPSVYEWDKTNLSQEKLAQGLERFLLNTEHVGVPHIAVAFPHITTVYRFGDPRVESERETNVYLVGKAPTAEQEAINLQSKSERSALGCLIEMRPILSEEVRFWAESKTVSSYLLRRVVLGSSLKVVDSNKLRRILDLLQF